MIVFESIFKRRKKKPKGSVVPKDEKKEPQEGPLFECTQLSFIGFNLHNLEVYGNGALSAKRHLSSGIDKSTSWPGDDKNSQVKRDRTAMDRLLSSSLMQSGRKTIHTTPTIGRAR